MFKLGCCMNTNTPPGVNICNLNQLQPLRTLIETDTAVMTWVRVAACGPLFIALDLETSMRRSEVHTVVIVAKKEAVDRGANISGIAIELDGIIALTVSLDPLSCGPLTYAPGRVILRASLMILD